MALRLKTFRAKDLDAQIESAEEHILRLICQLCKSGMYEQHSDPLRAYEGWAKCPVCGHCRQLKSDLSVAVSSRA